MDRRPCLAYCRPRRALVPVRVVGKDARAEHSTATSVKRAATEEGYLQTRQLRRRALDETPRSCQRWPATDTERSLTGCLEDLLCTFEQLAYAMQMRKKHHAKGRRRHKKSTAKRAFLERAAVEREGDGPQHRKQAPASSF